MGQLGFSGVTFLEPVNQGGMTVAPLSTYLD